MASKAKPKAPARNPIRYLKTYCGEGSHTLAERFVKGNPCTSKGYRISLVANSGEEWDEKEGDDWLSVHIETLGGETADLMLSDLERLIDGLEDIRVKADRVEPVSGATKQ